MKKIVRNIIPILIVLIWLMPVSNQINTLNDDMARNCYLLNLIILFIIFIYEGKFNIHQLLAAFSILMILIIATVVFYCLDLSRTRISYGYLMNYIPFCILINIKPIKLSKSKILDVLFIMICILLIIVGVLTVFGNTLIEQILKTYYVNHYPHVYTAMWMNFKTVTFFATHSIACYLYFIIWWLLDYRMQVKKGVLNIILIVGILFDIVMCSSVSAVLCIGIIGAYYYIKWAKKTTKKNLIRSIGLLIVGTVFVFANIERISLILSSNVNGILGRFGSSGHLNDTLKWAFANGVPLGICDIDGFWLTDGGYFVHYIRGGLLLLILMYYSLYRFILRNISDRKRGLFLFLSFMLFEVGYQFTICMRFFMLMIFAIMYYQSLCEEEQKLYTLNANA